MNDVGTLRTAERHRRVARVVGPRMGPTDRNSFQTNGFGAVICWLLLSGGWGFAASPAIRAERETGRMAHLEAGQLEGAQVASSRTSAPADRLQEWVANARRLPEVNVVRTLPELPTATVTQAGPVPLDLDLTRLEPDAASGEENQRIERLPLPAPTSPSDRETTSQAIRNENQPIDRLTTDIRPPAGRLPANVAADRFAREGVLFQGPDASRPWIGGVYQWESSALCHYPLYFEEINVERHGHRVPVAQPVISAAHFFATVPALPFLIALDPPHRPIYVLGHCRPGDLEACPIRRIPVLITPSVVEAALIVALCFAIP